jgi:hypothetical protein
MKTIHVAVGVCGEKNRIWVSPRMCELSNMFGKNFVAYHEVAPNLLRSFFRANNGMENLFCKGFAYWVICGVYDLKEAQGQYGLLKRRLKEFDRKLFRTIRSLADKIAREIKKRF